jgi:GLPGLI family protein
MTRILTVFLISLLITAGCRKNPEKPEIKQGRLEYRITYETDSAHQKLVDLLPHRMKLVFNQDSALNIMEGFMGLYRLNSISYFRTKKCSTLLKIPKYSFLYTGKRGEPMCCYDPMDNMIVHRTSETKDILGFNCRKAKITFPGSDYSFDVYYTNDIDIRNVNSTNPYKKIEGVLMEFELNMYYFRMRFTADKYIADSKSDIQFFVPANYQKLTRAQMTQLLGRYLE